jgi:hypothetical protein
MCIFVYGVYAYKCIFIFKCSAEQSINVYDFLITWYVLLRFLSFFIFPVFIVSQSELLVYSNCSLICSPCSKIRTYRKRHWFFIVTELDWVREYHQCYHANCCPTLSTIFLWRYIYINISNHSSVKRHGIIIRDF